MRIAAAVLAVLVGLVLMLGAAMGPTSPSAAAQGGTVPYPPSVPAAAATYPGGRTGCMQADPTGTGGCVTEATSWAVKQITTHFGALPTSCWDRHAWNPTSDHPLGRACDITFGRLGTFPGPDDVRRGWVLATWLRANVLALHVSYVIWQGRIWSAARGDSGWRTYTGGGVYDASDPTGGHYDHVHVSIAE